MLFTGKVLGTNSSLLSQFSGINQMPGGFVHDLKIQQQLRWWPTLQDYNEVIQAPMLCLQDAELKNGMPYTGALGLPRPITGAFASVYRMRCGDTDYALRLFLRNIENQSLRYERISKFVQNDKLPYTVTFDYLAQGIKSRSEWFPALKMEWVEGVPFEQYIIDNLRNTQKLEELANSFLKMMDEMRFYGIAHGDLQHGNIIMVGDEIRLVDYDGMFVPDMQNFMSVEGGHPNFQHPKRSDHHFGPYLDNFSAWVIYASIKALQVDPALLNQLGGGDDCLLFRKSDFVEPLQSAAFAAFERHENEELQTLGKFIRAQLDHDVIRVPHLQLPIPGTGATAMAPISPSVSTIKSGPRIELSNPSDWLQDDNVGELVKPRDKSSVEESPQPKPSSWVVQHRTAQPSEWVKPTEQDLATKTSSVGGITTGLVSSDLTKALLSTRVPRPVELRDGRLPPEAMQALMLLCPAFWIGLFFLVQIVTVDESLRAHATTYNAAVEIVERSNISTRQGYEQHTRLKLVYRVNDSNYVITVDLGPDGRSYKDGDIVPVTALPSDPSVTEPFMQRAGTKQRGDLLWAFFCLMINLGLELVIWLRPMDQKYLAERGIPTDALITSFSQTKASNQQDILVAGVSYNVNHTDHHSSIVLSWSEYQQLQRGTRETILCDPQNTDRVIFYKFCMYKPTLP